MCGHRAKTCDLLFSGLRSSRPYVRGGMNLYRRYAGFSPASKGSVMLSLLRRPCRYTDSTRVVVTVCCDICDTSYAVTFAIHALAHRVRCQAHCQEILIISLSSSMLAASTRKSLRATMQR